MNCPVDGTQLVLSERNGVEIDYCPQCRGVWLDRGELDKILDRAALVPGYGDSAIPPPGYPAQPGYGDGHHRGHGGKRRRGGWLGEIFD